MQFHRFIDTLIICLLFAVSLYVIGFIIEVTKKNLQKNCRVIYNKRVREKIKWKMEFIRLITICHSFVKFLGKNMLTIWNILFALKRVYMAIATIQMDNHQLIKLYIYICIVRWFWYCIHRLISKSLLFSKKKNVFYKIVFVSSEMSFSWLFALKPFTVFLRKCLWYMWVYI